MAQDVRRITFATEEVIHALEVYRASNSNFLPQGRISAAVPGKDHALIVSIETIQSGVTMQMPVRLSSFDILKALIRFCIDNKIMLPRAGQKSFSITDNSASLNIRLDIPVIAEKKPGARGAKGQVARPQPTIESAPPSTTAH